ncbi:nickel pincer cofactor biosynthesis protein LarC [soil metagenome]
MTVVLYVDAIGGAAGDMLLAALLDAGAPEAAVSEAIASVVPAARISTETVGRGGLRATFLRVAGLEPVGGGGGPRGVEELLEALEAGTGLPMPVAGMARSILQRVGEAESRVHGGGSASSLHALGDPDTLVDVVGVAAALHSLGVERMLVSSLPLGAGGIAGEVGDGHAVPPPAPATLELVRGFAVRPGGTDETVTPTAAAIIAAVGEPIVGFPAMTIRSVGYGAGARDPAERPNVVRVVLGDAVDERGPEDPEAGPSRQLCVLEANLDDLSPELVADAVSALLGAGALDACTTPIQMNKGRPGWTISVICERGAEPRISRELFLTTSTFGVRSHLVTRSELPRRIATVRLEGGVVRVKIGTLGDRVVSATPEHDDVAAVAANTGRPVRAVYEEAAAAARALILDGATP